MSDKHKAVFLYNPAWETGGYPDTCPFNSKRAGKTRNVVASMGLLGGSGGVEREPRPASLDEMAVFHAPRYLAALKAAGTGDLTPEGLSMGLGTPDCPVFKDMLDYAASTAGATLTGARLILAGTARTVFNPAGGYHHAGPDYASGFCYINDIVLATMELTAAGRRVLFLDLDVHHSDGVQAAFYKRRDVMTVSLHESGKTLFPGTGFENEIGIGEGRGYSVNVPLPVGTHDAAYKMAFDEVVMPLLNAFDPDVVVLELGMDTLAGDPLAHLHLTNNVYADILLEIMALDKPVLATGGGGYHVENTVRAWALLWSVMCGEHTDDLSMGMGGVMLESTEWAGGLRDRVLLTDAGKRGQADTEIRRVIAAVRSTVFPLHGLR